MKGNGDVGLGWLKRAESDFAAAEVLANNATALEGVCFHCQQAAEKSLKGWLIAHDVRAPKTHMLKDLIKLCAQKQSRFEELLSDANALTPYATKLRYAADFWPSMDQARTALEQARRIYDFVKAHWS